jgi:hypothetical protein
MSYTKAFQDAVNAQALKITTANKSTPFANKEIQDTTLVRTILYNYIGWSLANNRCYSSTDTALINAVAKNTAVLPETVKYVMDITEVDAKQGRVNRNVWCPKRSEVIVQTEPKVDLNPTPPPAPPPTPKDNSKYYLAGLGLIVFVAALNFFKK